MTDTTLSFETAVRVGRSGDRTPQSKVATTAIRSTPGPRRHRLARIVRHAAALLTAVQQPASGTQPQLLAGPTGGPIWTAES